MYQPTLFGKPRLSPEPPLIGYALTADNPDKSKEFGTFMMARTIGEAFEWCIEYFPIDEGFVHLMIRNVDTREERFLTPKEYIGKNGELSHSTTELSPERKAELILHIPECEIILQSCSECWEFYSTEGHDEYVRVFTENNVPKTI
jgi:hypothetical protein